MSRKILIIAILVIVLVSINWFQSLVAQDLSQLSDEEKQALIDKYRKSAPKQDPNKSYKSADLYGDKEDPLAAHRMQRSAWQPIVCSDLPRNPSRNPRICWNRSRNRFRI